MDKRTVFKSSVRAANEKIGGDTSGLSVGNGLMSKTIDTSVGQKTISVSREQIVSASRKAMAILKDAQRIPIPDLKKIS